VISRRCLFDYVEEQSGLPARVKAENRFKELWLKWPQAQELRTGRGRLIAVGSEARPKSVSIAQNASLRTK
jgi:hypothetical protein